MARTKTTGLAAFTNRRSAPAAPDEASVAAPASDCPGPGARAGVGLPGQEGRGPQQAAREGMGLPWP